MTAPAWLRLARLAPLALLASACASGDVPLFDPGASRARQDEIERRLFELEQESVRSRLEVERLRRRLAALEGAAAAPVAPGEPAAAPAAAPPVETAEAAAPRPPAEIEESELDAEMPAAAPPAAAPPVTPEEQYEQALRLLRDGHPAEAEAALAAFAGAHPASDLADNAWFWIGEARLVRDDVAGALAAYRTAVETYPMGNKTPDALFKIGHCLARQGDAATAGEIWRELVRRFPDTAAAGRAREALGPAPEAGS